MDETGRKYNNWCERKGLHVQDEERLRRAYAYSARKDLSNREKDAYFMHELTDCEGLEFVAFSSLRFDSQLILSDRIVLTPCSREAPSRWVVCGPRLILTKVPVPAGDMASMGAIAEFRLTLMTFSQITGHACDRYGELDLLH